jgi:hypothetical protein
MCNVQWMYSFMLRKVLRLRLNERDTAYVLHLRYPNALIASVAEGVVL